MISKNMHECTLHVSELSCCALHAGMHVSVGVKKTFASLQNVNLLWVIMCKASQVFSSAGESTMRSSRQV